MRLVSGHGGRATYSVAENVIWLACPPKDRSCRRIDAVNSLKQSVTRLIAEVERSGRLKTDIAAAVDARRYELYKRSVTVGAHASDRTLAAAQRIHLGSVLKFVHTIAAAGPERRAVKIKPAASLDRLAKSIRDLEATVVRAQQLSRECCRNLKTSIEEDPGNARLQR